MLVQPIRDTMTSVGFKWSTAAAHAFTEVKEAVLSSLALALFDPDKEVILTTDASGYGIGAVLTQVANGQGITIAFASRKLTTCKQKFSTGEREALSLCMGGAKVPYIPMGPTVHFVYGPSGSDYAFRYQREWASRYVQSSLRCKTA